MTIHDGFLELAATAIDFELEPEERAELDRHLAGCDSCRETTEAYREDAATIASAPGPRLESGRSVAILAAALRPKRSGPPVRGLAIAALVAVLGGGLLAAGLEVLRRSDNSNVAVLSPGPSNASGAPPSVEASPRPTGSDGGTPQPPAPTQRPVGSPTVGAIQVRGDGQELGTLIRLAPGPAGDLYVSIPASDGTVLGRLDETGAPAPGWPVFLPGSESCDQLLPVASGSVRVLCHRPAAEEGLGGMITRVHAFDANGQPLPDWPVEIDDVVVGRMVGDDLMLLVKPYVGDVSEADTPEQVFLGIVAADGTSRRGAEVSFECCEHSWAIGPDGIGYGTTHRDWDTSVKTDIQGFGTDGLRAGWPITIDGNLLRPRIRRRGTRLRRAGLAWCRAGAERWSGTGTAVRCRDRASRQSSRRTRGTAPAPTIRGHPSSAPMARRSSSGPSTSDTAPTRSTRAATASPAGHTTPPWRSRRRASARRGDTGCGGFRTAPAVGPGNVLYLVHAAGEGVRGWQRRCDRTGWQHRRRLAGDSDPVRLGVLVGRRGPEQHRVRHGSRAGAERQLFGDDPGDRPGQRHPLQRDDRRAVGTPVRPARTPPAAGTRRGPSHPRRRR